MEPSNKTADLSALRIRRDAPPERGRWVLPAVATGIVVAIAVALAWGRSTGASPSRRPRSATTRVALVTPAQASTVLTASRLYRRALEGRDLAEVGRARRLDEPRGGAEGPEGRARRPPRVAGARGAAEASTSRRVEQVLADLANARIELQRARALLKDQVGSQQAFDAAEAQVRGLEAQQRSVEAQVRYVDELIKNAEIYSPIDGVVTVKKAFVGETVAPQGYGGAGSAGATFAVIVDLGSLEMEADINEQNLGKLSIGQPAEVTLDAYPDHPYQGAPPADRADGRPAEGLGQGEGRAPRQGREGPARDVVPRRLPRPSGEGRHRGEAQADGSLRLARRGGRQPGRS